jgi:hypothetical protein
MTGSGFDRKMTSPVRSDGGIRIPICDALYRSVHLAPFSRYGVRKFARLGTFKFRSAGGPSPGPERRDAFVRTLLREHRRSIAAVGSCVANGCRNEKTCPHHERDESLARRRRSRRLDAGYRSPPTADTFRVWYTRAVARVCSR